mmetsp:Transcript_11043/g.17617  ORF Transcript_11043/g.17617 Transcript_11043/m.17617 type:complete len:268 (-) Transcript_11043:247-1050(-)
MAASVIVLICTLHSSPLLAVLCLLCILYNASPHLLSHLLGSHVLPEEVDEFAILPYKVMDDRVVYQVVCVIRLDPFVVVNTVSTADLLNLLLGASEASDARVELGAVLVHQLWRVALRVDADEDRSGNRAKLCVQKLNDSCLLLHLLGADVGAKREAEVDQKILSSVILVSFRLPLPIHELKGTTQPGRAQPLRGRDSPRLRLLSVLQVVVIPETEASHEHCKKCGSPGELHVLILCLYFSSVRAKNWALGLLRALLRARGSRGGLP